MQQHDPSSSVAHQQPRTDTTRGMAALFGIALALITATASWAGPGDEDFDPVGRWSFQTERFEERSCEMSGELSVAETPVEHLYRGDLLTFEACAGADIVIAAEQTSTVRVMNDVVLIQTHRVVRVEPPVPYRPDHFHLKIQDNDTLIGALVTNVQATATFVRIHDEDDAMAHDQGETP